MRADTTREPAFDDRRAHPLVFRDFTAQVEHETTENVALRHVEAERARLHALLTNLPIAVVVFGAADFQIEFANDAYLAMVDRKDVVGRTLAEIVPGVSPESIYSYLSEVRREKQPRERREHALLLPSAEGAALRYFTNKFHPLFDEQGQVRQVMVTVLDVTHEVRARSLVVEAAERLRVVLDEMPVGANVRDATTGRLIISNKASTAILGVELRGRADSAESLGLLNARFPDGRLLGPDDHAFRRAIITQRPVRNQTVILNRVATNEERVVRSSAALVEGPGTNPLVVSVIEDITDEHRLLAEREQTARFAETFVGILAHDLRTPLSAISMGAALLEARLAATPQDAKLVARIAASARRMAEMVTQLLDLTQSRLAGGIHIERAPVDLVAVLNGVLDEIAVANPGVTLSRELPADLVGEWDGARLAQVVSNVVGNAVQHGDRSRPIAVALEACDATARLTVRSHGPVIPDVRLEEIFDPFQRQSRAPRGKTAGLGLGMYITRQIVSGHGGSIRATSTEADGTVFAITLPRFAS